MSIPNFENIAKFFLIIGVVLLAYTLVYVKPSNDPVRTSNYQVKQSTKEVDETYKPISEHMKLLDEHHKKQTALFKTLDSMQLAKTPPKIALKSMKDFEKNYPSPPRINDSAYRRAYKEFQRVNLVSSEAYEKYKDLLTDALLLTIIGSIFFILGITGLQKKENFAEVLLIRQNLDKPTFSKHCQSCGKQFNSIIIPGTDSSGVKNYHICSECLENGIYKDSDKVTLISRIEAELTVRGIKPPDQDKIVKNLDKLDRWKGLTFGST